MRKINKGEMRRGCDIYMCMRKNVADLKVLMKLMEREKTDWKEYVKPQ